MEKPGTRKKSILIIEDEMEMRFYLMTLVTSMGHRPLVTRNGVQGLEALDQTLDEPLDQALDSLAGTSLPDLIILDVMMPEKGGALVYLELKSHEVFRKIPLVIFSGVDPKAFAHYVKMLNADTDRDIPAPKYYVEKSADPDYLKKVITDCMNDPDI